MPPQEPIQNVAPVSNQPPVQTLPPKPKNKLVSLIIACLVGLVTVLVVYWATNYAISFWATFYCTGWNEGSGQVTSCSIPGIESWANNGYGMELIAAFTLDLVYFIPALIALVCGIYWFKKIRDWKNENVPTRVFVWAGLVFSVVSFLAFVAPVAWFPFSLIIDQHNTKVQFENALQTVATPTATNFACGGGNSIDIDSNGAVGENNFSESIKGTTLIGHIDNTNKTFTWWSFGYARNDYTSSLISRYTNELQSCKNVDGKTVFELYREIPSTGFYQ
jgi:hypothetical protein